MDTLSLLQRRRSSKKFGDIAPTKEQLEVILKAGLRAPDHGKLKPYRFIVIEKSAMPTLQTYLEAAAREFEMGEEGLVKAAKISQKAPLMLAVVAKITPDIPKVPAWEQMLSAGCATYAMQLAANAQGFETCWISNKWVNGSLLRQAFGCEERDKIIALVMVGSPAEENEITLASQTEELNGFVHYLEAK